MNLNNSKLDSENIQDSSGDQLNNDLVSSVDEQEVQELINSGEEMLEELDKISAQANKTASEIEQGISELDEIENESVNELDELMVQEIEKLSKEDLSSQD